MAFLGILDLEFANWSSQWVKPWAILQKIYRWLASVDFEILWHLRFLCCVRDPIGSNLKSNCSMYGHSEFEMLVLLDSWRSLRPEVEEANSADHARIPPHRADCWATSPQQLRLAPSGLWSLSWLSNVVRIDFRFSQSIQSSSIFFDYFSITPYHDEFDFQNFEIDFTEFEHHWQHHWLWGYHSSFELKSEHALGRMGHDYWQTISHCRLQIVHDLCWVSHSELSRFDFGKLSQIDSNFQISTKVVSYYYLKCGDSYQFHWFGSVPKVWFLKDLLGWLLDSCWSWRLW